MAAMKCGDCAYWSFKEGCRIERQNYWQFRDCMTGKKDYSHPKDHTQKLADNAGKTE